MLLICAASSGHNLVLAQKLQELSREQDIETAVLDLTEIHLPLFTPAEEKNGRPPALDPVERQFAAASGFLFCAPEYNGSIPPTLTNAIAWLSTQSDDFRALFNGKPVALATRSGGAGQKVLIAMRLQFSHLGCNVLGRELSTSSSKPLNEGAARNVLAQLSRLFY
jgi:chromate reductase, NAD(P)H dehydrogenase (quinone)